MRMNRVTRIAALFIPLLSCNVRSEDQFDVEGYFAFRAQAIAIYEDGEIEDAERIMLQYYELKKNLTTADFEVLARNNIDPYFNFFVVNLRLFNIYLHVGDLSKARFYLDDSVRNSQSIFTYYIKGITLREKRLIQVYTWRYLDSEIKPVWQRDNFDALILDAIRETEGEELRTAEKEMIPK